ncbi:hypothetical protein WMY93_006727 [Mugilogobius chulae]|uniref:Uncharacterized protein n=1 Tax=Mugilogobius chulae TaxID=88201 RepID=A0AAW0PUB2_9GOBI
MQDVLSVTSQDRDTSHVCLCVSDFRQSSTVTKFFRVDDVTDPDPTNHSPPLILLTNEDEVQVSLAPPTRLRSSNSTSCPGSPASCGHKHSDQKKKMKTSPEPDLRPEDSTFLQTLSRIEKTRIQRETDFLRCPDCLTLRPSDPAAVFCSLCGARLGAVPAAAPPADRAQAPPPASAEAPPTAEQSTQTVGLFFPSATALRSRPNQNQDPDRDRDQDRGRGQRRPRGGVSPGRGFWRQQVDHVCAHLRSHAQNHAPFRTLLGEPRLGRLVSAVVQEDPHEVTLTLSFSRATPALTPVTPVTPVTSAMSRADRPAPAGGAAGLQTLSSVTEGVVQ